MDLCWYYIDELMHELHRTLVFIVNSYIIHMHKMEHHHPNFEYFDQFYELKIYFLISGKLKPKSKHWNALFYQYSLNIA